MSVYGKEMVCYMYVYMCMHVYMYVVSVGVLYN